MIDALVGLVILSIAILAYFSLAQKTTDQTVAAQNRETALFLAESALVVVKNSNETDYNQAKLDADIAKVLQELKNNNPALNNNYAVTLTAGKVENYGTHVLTPYTITVSWPVRILGINRTENVRISGYHTN